MTPTIDQIEAALPYVPAGLHCGDLTEPDERREFAEVIHGIVEQAARRPGSPMADWPETAPESRLSDEQGSSAPTVPGNGDGRNNGVSSCARCGKPITLDDAAIAYEALGKRVEKHVRCMTPIKPTDMSIAWGISEALIEEAE